MYCTTAIWCQPNCTQQRYQYIKFHRWTKKVSAADVCSLRHDHSDCVHTNRVESSRVTRVLPSQESWCRMFYFRQSNSSDWAWRLLTWGINGCLTAYSFT